MLSAPHGHIVFSAGIETQQRLYQQGIALSRTIAVPTWASHDDGHDEPQKRLRSA